MPNRKNRKNTMRRGNRKAVSRKNHRQTNRSRRVMYGGGGGAGWTLGPAVAPQAPYAQTNQPYDACLSAPRPGQISYADQGGLPGMSPSPVMKGGAMPNMGAPVMKGGAAGAFSLGLPPGELMPVMKGGYAPVDAPPGAGAGNVPPGPIMTGGACSSGCSSPANGDLATVPLMKGGGGCMAPASSSNLPLMKGGRYTNNLAAGDIAGFAQIDKVPCEPNWKNPLNQAGGGSGGLQNAADMGVYEAPTARYTHSPSQWTDSVGAPVLLNVPLDAKMWSRACTQTGGRRRKARKGGRKGRKATRRSRK
jgi:hypothetical protein